MVLSAREDTLSEHCAESVKTLIEPRKRGLGEDVLVCVICSIWNAKSISYWCSESLIRVQ